MSTALAIRQSNEVLAPKTINELQILGTALADSGFFQDAKGAAQAMAKIMAGAELGFPPVASMNGIYIVKGRISLSANLMAAAVKRSGKYDYKIKTINDTICELEFFENGVSVGMSSFSKAEAQKAGTQNMDKFPRNMLFARAMSNGVKWYCADIFAGAVYTPEEMGATVDGEGEVINPAALSVMTNPEPEKPQSKFPDSAHRQSIMSQLGSLFLDQGKSPEEFEAIKAEQLDQQSDKQLAVTLGRWEAKAEKKRLEAEAARESESAVDGEIVEEAESTESFTA